MSDKPEVTLKVTLSTGDHAALTLAAARFRCSPEAYAARVIQAKIAKFVDAMDPDSNGILTPYAAALREFSTTDAPTTEEPVAAAEEPKKVSKPKAEKKEAAVSTPDPEPTPEPAADPTPEASAPEPTPAPKAEKPKSEKKKTEKAPAPAPAPAAEEPAANPSDDDFFSADETGAEAPAEEAKIEEDDDWLNEE